MMAGRTSVLSETCPVRHRDPFDRRLVAQAMLEDLVLVSNERIFEDYSVKRLW
jgi:PIN domain nuclease of toxin-antitoxin system